MRLSYQEIETSYDQIKRSACGRQACSVMILVANEVLNDLQSWDIICNVRLLI